MAFLSPTILGTVTRVHKTEDRDHRESVQRDDFMLVGRIPTATVAN